MARKKISVAFRKRLSGKLMDLGNFVAVGLIIEQFGSHKEVSISLLIAGFLIAVFCYIISFIVSK